ncbi:MAG: histidine kinase [Lewinellaceae bacterium]|nr:histidine kinase [Phaeodactylibacter sp.]MCB9035382.1 histidine kinase [Lewinellaceae bacterium]
MNKTTSPGTSFFQMRLVQHLAFWGLSFYILARHFAYEQEIQRVDLIYTLLFHLSLWLAVYANLLVLIPRLLQRRRYGLYAISIAALLAAGTYLNILTFDSLADRLFPGYYFISYFKASEIAQYHIVYLAAATLLKLSKGWFEAQQQQKRIAQLEKEKAEAELRALKAQVDPHFLFNTLNNLYSFALDGSPQVPEAILRLADCMRYMLYDCNARQVALEKELEYIRNYIELQRLRLGESAQVEMAVEGSAGEVEVPPLLFIPFVENAFKHGLKGDGQAAFARIRFRVGSESIFFNIENDTAPPGARLPGTQGGIGLDNVKKRLNLLFPQRHELVVYEDGKVFSVTLKINKKWY